MLWRMVCQAGVDQRKPDLPDLRRVNDCAENTACRPAAILTSRRLQGLEAFRLVRMGGSFGATALAGHTH